MSGWKTWAGGLGLILTGGGIIASCIASKDFSNLDKGISLVSAGLGIIGIGHKVEKASK